MQQYSRETLAVVAGRPGRTPGAPVGPGVELASTYIQPGDIDADLPVYGRYGNATWAALEETVGGLGAHLRARSRSRPAWRPGPRCSSSCPAAATS